MSQKLHVPERMVHQSLSVLKGLEPYGVFSANIQECLLCQLDALDMNSEILTCMVCSHLQDIADGKISNISRSLHVPTVEVRKSIEIISHLNPRPLSGFHTGNSSYIIPDIIFKKEDGEWTAVLNDNWIENYHLKYGRREDDWRSCRASEGKISGGCGAALSEDYTVYEDFIE